MRERTHPEGWRRTKASAGPARKSYSSNVVRGIAGVRGSCGARFLALAVLGALSLEARRSLALEPRSITEPDVLQQPALVTDVVDGFDGGTDLHFSLVYQHTWKSAQISRETQSSDVNPAAAGGTARFRVADYSEVTSRLNVRAELGLYHDLALILRLPVILSRSSTLQGAVPLAGALDGAPGEELFSVPFSSPNRSGVEYLGVGIDWGILNQWRDAAQPTLVVGAEGRFSVSEPMHACGPARTGSDGEAGEVRCAQPADINRDGLSGQYPAELAPGRLESLEGSFPEQSRKAGVSRGTTALELHGMISRRFAQLEPYMGLSALFELPSPGSDFGPDRAWKESIGSRAAVSLGVEVMPWEVAEQFQRLSIDLRFIGTYREAGRDYAELFDALGSSRAPSYRRPSFAGYLPNDDPSGPASVVDPDSERVFPTGISNVEAHGTYALRVLARWQAGRYVHFDLGAGWALTQEHVITLGAPCNGARSVAVERAGPCRSPVTSSPATSGPATSGPDAEPVALGAPDPSYRPETEQPGHRFIVGTASTVDAWVGATVMF
ncbi:MAG: hypothetical protein RL685_985 [Pseudomonadota bacterium]